MEPRPQRPRSTPSQQSGAPQSGRSAPSPSGQTEGYVDGIEVQTFIAPPRTDYDYSPLDLAPPGQRRRRQFVAAAVGALAVLMVVAIAVLGYLLFGDDEDDPSVDVAALATENAATRAALDQESTTIADAAAAQTATAGGEAVSTEVSTEESESTTESDESAAEPTEVAEGEPTEEGAAAEPTEEGAAAEPTEEGAAASGGPTVTELEALLPADDTIPAQLDAVAESDLDLEAVVVALGSSRTVEQNLETWGWSGNVGRTWTPSDLEVVEPGVTTSLAVSIHGFQDAESGAEAITFYSDVLVSSVEGTEEGTDPGLGDSSRLLTSTDENGGVVVALYVQQGNVLYRFGGYAPSGGDPTDDVIELATATLAGGT